MRETTRSVRGMLYVFMPIFGDVLSGLPGEGHRRSQRGTWRRVRRCDGGRTISGRIEARNRLTTGAQYSSMRVNDQASLGAEVAGFDAHGIKRWLANRRQTGIGMDVRVSKEPIGLRLTALKFQVLARARVTIHRRDGPFEARRVNT